MIKIYLEDSKIYGECFYFANEERYTYRYLSSFDSMVYKGNHTFRFSEYPDMRNKIEAFDLITEINSFDDIDEFPNECPEFFL